MKWLNLDLPNLTSIISSNGMSFWNSRSVRLESILKYWILIWSRYSESSKCQTTYFIQECSIEINIEYCLIDLISFIDVSRKLLADPVQINQWFQYWIYKINCFYLIQWSLHVQCFLSFFLCSKPLIIFLWSLI